MVAHEAPPSLGFSRQEHFLAYRWSLISIYWVTKRFLKFNIFTLVLLRDFIIDLFRIHGKVEGEKTSALYHTSLWNLNTNPILCPFSSQYFINRLPCSGVRILYCVCWCVHPVVLLCSFTCIWLFCESVDCSLPGSSLHGIFQARILEWIATSFSRIFLKQGWNPCLLHWQAISFPQSHHPVL